MDEVWRNNAENIIDEISPSILYVEEKDFRKLYWELYIPCSKEEKAQRRNFREAR